jgi:hypothetical protein
MQNWYICPSLPYVYTRLFNTVTRAIRSLHSQRTGGFFQCNRFNDDATTGDNPRQSEMRTQMHGLDSGNAHVDAVRQREAAMKIARYIHHFTRYKAHGSSAVLESRMAQDSLSRLEDTLTRSIHVNDEGNIMCNYKQYVQTHSSLLYDKVATLNKSGCEVPSPHTEALVEAEVAPLLCWLVEDSSFNPLEDMDVYVYSEPLQSVRQHMFSKHHQHISVPKLSLEFLRLGFEELSKSRHVRSHYILFLYFYSCTMYTV